MRRVAIIADSHFDEASRFEECIRIHDWIADECKRRDVDLVLHSGDVYERKSTPKEREAVARWVQRITQTAPIVIVRGNHDALGDLPLLERLETDHTVEVVERADRVIAGQCVIACIGWPNKASILALGAESHEVGELVAGDALRNVIRGLGADIARENKDELLETNSYPRIVLMHAMVRGSKVSTGQPLVGCDLEVGLDDLRLANADLYALGHIHKPQCWDEAGPSTYFEPEVEGSRYPVSALPDVVYPGSPRRTSYGELEDKHFVIATFDDAGKLVDVEYVKTPSTPMAHLRAEYATEHVGLPGDVLVPAGIFYDSAPVSEWCAQGAEIRVRYYVEPEHRDAAKVAAEALKSELLELGASDVKLEPIVETTTRARAPELAQVSTLTEKLDAYWRAKDTVPDEVRRRKLLEKTALLEGGVS